MSRNGSGTYSVVNSFTAGTTIESAKINANFSDIGSEITNSLPRDGQAAMTGQLKAAAGTAALPSVTFSSDPDTGFYRKDANQPGVSCGGTLVAYFDSGGLKTASDVAYDAFPSGTVLIFGQTAAPTGWTKLTDQNDAALRVVSGTASTGGSTAFSTVFASRTIAAANLPDHSVGISITDNGHTHTYGTNQGSASGGGGVSAGTISGTGNTTGSSVTGITATGSFGATERGSSQTAMDFAVKYVDVIRAQKD